MATATKRKAKKSKSRTIKARKPLDPQEKLMRQMHRLGLQIARKKDDLLARETSVSQAESDLKSKRKDRNETEKELQQLHEELAGLAQGKFSERLDFSDSDDDKSAPNLTQRNTGTAAQAMKEGLDQVTADKLEAQFHAATLDDIGIAGAMKEKLEADGIRNGRDLQAWMQLHPPRKIVGIGESAREKINSQMATWYEKQGTNGQQQSPAANSTVAPIRIPSDFNLEPGEVEAACHPHLLVSEKSKLRVVLEKDGTGLKVTEKPMNGCYVVTPSPSEYGNDVYALRPLYAKAPGEPSPDDPFHCHVVLSADGRYVFEIGPWAEAILVRDGDADPPKADRDASDDAGDEAEDGK